MQFSFKRGSHITRGSVRTLMLGDLHVDPVLQEPVRAALSLREARVNV